MESVPTGGMATGLCGHSGPRPEHSRFCGAKAADSGWQSLAVFIANLGRQSASLFLLTFAINLLALVLPLTVLETLNRVSEVGTWGGLELLIAAALLAILADTALRLARDRSLARNAFQQSLRTQTNGATRLLHAKPSAVRHLGPGAAEDALQGLDARGRIQSSVFHLALLDLPFTVILLSAMWWIGGPAVFATILPIAGLGIWLMRSRGALRCAAEDVDNTLRRERSFLAMCRNAVSIIRSLGAETQMTQRYEHFLEKRQTAVRAAILAAEQADFAARLFSGAMLIAIAAYAAYSVRNDMMSIGAAAACLILALKISQPFQIAARLWGLIETAKISSRQAEPIASLPPASDGDLQVSRPAILQLDDVSLTENETPRSHSGLYLTLGRGEVVGLVCDDSTERQAIARLVLGEEAPSQGQIRIDHINPYKDDTISSRQGLLRVGPAPEILRGSVVENISMFGSIWPSIAMDVARRLGVEERIKSLPRAYATHLDETNQDDFSRDFLHAITLVRAAAIRPRLLILDTGSLEKDGIAARARAGLFSELNGISTILILDRNIAAMRVATRTYRLRNGALEIAEDTGRQLDDCQRREPAHV